MFLPRNKREVSSLLKEYKKKNQITCKEAQFTLYVYTYMYIIYTHMYEHIHRVNKREIERENTLIIAQYLVSII